MPATRASAFPAEREFWLHKFDLMVLLVLNIVLHHMFGEPRRGNKVSSTPQRTERKLLGLLLDPCGGFALYQLHSVCNRVFGWYGDVQMNVLISHMPRVYGESLPPCDHLEYSLEFEFNVPIRKHGTAILWCPNQMVVASPRAMVQVIQPSIGHGG